jgi:predicted MFS family arabinose efflux permease
LTGAFQSVQWAAIYGASILVGVVGGYIAEQRNLHAAFAVAAVFPAISFVMALLFIRETPAPSDREAFRRTLAAIQEAFGERDVWLVAGFILFWTFSPSFGPAFLYYQTDTLKFSQQFIGILASMSAVGFVLGAIIYAPLSRRVSLKRLINLAIAGGLAGTLAYLFYRDWISAMIIDSVFGCVAMITQLAFLDLAAKACPRRVEASFFALLMSVYNLGVRGSHITGGYLYDSVGFTTLVWISAAVTALTWLLVPLIRIDGIEAKARAEAALSTP